MSSQQAEAVIKQFAESRNDSSISVLEFIGILTIWIAMIAICNPIGNFPLNDDWAYADSVRKLLEGKIVLHDWTAANLFSQLFWGALFCKAFGFSYTTLRISSLVLGFIGILITYQLALQLSKNKQTAFALCILTAVNPIFFASSNTFMTEIPFFAFSLASILFLTNAFRSSSWVDISVGTVFVIIAMLSRQIELAIPMAFAIAYPINKKINTKTLLQASLPLAICILTQILFKAWLEAENKIPFTYGYQIHLLKETLKLPPLEMAKIIYSNTIKSITLIAFFCSPFVFLKSKTKSKANTAYIITTILLSAVTWKYAIPHTFPITGNILNKGGIGPGSYEYSPSRKLTQIWTAIGVISTFASIAMIANFARYLFKSFKFIREKNLNPIKLPLFSY
ncbi:glycosyltransferase family 39 protein [Aquitalea sp.]|uniref:ArnT family glycosyltransferase n=1 Tax=Aquitalea sp. TaxID=1872623 RepID=UPI00258D280F|nr:glycosyltransferase family 39 protein [Aquitalea sp.]